MAMKKFEIYLERQMFPENTFMDFLRKETKATDNRTSPHLIINPHYSETRYISDEITDEVIKSWKPAVPVIIDAQTGAGKNFFILNKLMSLALDRHRTKPNTILIVSNRIALTRQTKLQFAKGLVLVTGIYKYTKEIENYYTNEGVDNLYIDFDVITVCSYHQLFERKILDQKQFDYVIFDECHFFTSDSAFNPNTDKILRYCIKNAQNSIRIYLSATPEIACESIIAEEFRSVQIEKDNFVSEVKNFANSSTYRVDRFLTHPQYPNSDAMGHIIEKETSVTYRTIEFYYFKRNYDYLNFVGTYSKNDELISQIKKSDSKWIVFVQSNSEGKEFKEKLFAEGISACFISRDEIEASKKNPNTLSDDASVNDLKKSTPVEEYNYLIENETFRPKVLISTSIIDNGINIKNDGKKLSDKVLNMAINSLDRTSFLQMLGRIRVSDNTQVNLYIKKHSVGELKQAVSRNVDTLLTVLNNDFQSIDDKKKNYNDKLFRYSDDTKIFSEYNDCTISQLINLIAFWVRIVKQNEPDYQIKLSAEMDALREKIWLHYKDDDCGSWNKSFSRSVVDLLESDSGAQTRQRYIEEDIKCGVPENRYSYTTDDTFTKFIFSELIPSAISKDVQDCYDTCLRTLEPNEQRIFNTLVDREENRRNDKLSVVGKLQIIQSRFPKKYVQSYIDEIISLENKIQYYKRLADESQLTDLLAAQLQWIEKFDCYNPLAIDTPLQHIESHSDLEDFIKTHAVSISDISANQRGKSGKSLDALFLKAHGVAKDSDLENKLSKNFFDGKSFTDLLKDRDNPPYVTVENIQYDLKSFTTNTNDHKTYYLFVHHD